MPLIRKKKSALALLHDVAVSILAWAVAYLLRFNFQIPADFVHSMWQTMAWVVPLQALVFWRFGLYRGVWRYASLPDLQRILSAVAVAALLVASALLLLRLPVIVPRSVLVLNPLLLILLMGGSRLLYRAWKEHRLYGISQIQGQPVLVLGGGEAAIALLKDLDRSPEWRVIGVLDDNPELQGRQLYGVRVLGAIDRLPELAVKLTVEHVIVAMPGVAHEMRRRAVDLANQANLTVFTVPSFDDLMGGKVSITQIRPIEVEDLLGREPVRLDEHGLEEMLSGAHVMVTGAGGSIGSELCRQIAKFQPRRLTCFEISEFALYRLEQEFQEAYPDLDVSYMVGDIRNRQRVDQVLRGQRPAIIFHAAAYKHVPMMENGNISEALHNNVLGTRVLAEACIAHGVAKFVLISTDKAVNPANVMGASKRMAELVCQGLQQEQGTRFVVVRFGNVLGSSGSVIPKFREQLSKGGPLTVTHPDITRYFMSIPEAAQLVLQAALMGKGGEIFVLDMGEPVRIADLARDMIKLSGLSPEQIEIVYTGLRPGEKLYEELLADDETTLPTPHAKLRTALARPADRAWVEELSAWIASTPHLADSEIRSQISRWVTEYTGSTSIERANSDKAATT